MPDFANPYQSPETVSVPEKPLVQQRFLTDTMLRYLKEASPWLRFIGILGFVGAGMMCAAGLIFGILVFAVPGLFSSLDGFEELGGIGAEIFSGIYGALGFVYIAIGAIMFLPARFTYNFGNKIRMYLLISSDEELELALKNNKSLWKFYGILAIIYLAFIPLMIIGGIIVAIVTMIGSI